LASAKDTKGRLDYEVSVILEPVLLADGYKPLIKNDVASRRHELEERGWVKPLPDVHRPTADAIGMAWALTPAGRMVWEHDIEPYL
jgi:hypothetical protein